MTSKVIGTAFQNPNANGEFASGRGAICSIGYIAPTVIASTGGQQIVRRDKED